MNVNKQDLEKSQVELNVELSPEEFQPFIDKAVQEISQETTIEGFRPGKASYEVVKQKVGEMSILDKAARIAVNETLDKAIQENVEGQPIGQPQVDVTKLSSGNPMAYKAVISLLPEVKLGDYKNVPVEAEQVEPNEEEVDKTVKTLQEQYAEEKEVDRGAQKGDKVTVDINMSQDNVPVEGGQSQDTDVTLGQNYLVPGFDDNLIGSKKEDDLNFQIQYPENHHQKNLAGQNVDFNVKVKGVKERNIPEVDDEFAKKFGINSLDELKNILRDNISQEQKQKADQRTEIKMIDQILEKSEFGDIPTSLIDQEANKMLSEIQQNVTSQGGKFEDYLQSIGKSQEQLLEEMKPEAEKRVKTALLIREIANQENIAASEEEIEQKQNELLEQYKGYEKVEERVKSPDYKNYLQNIIVNNKVLEQLKKWNIKESSSGSADSNKDEEEKKESESKEDSPEKDQDKEKDQKDQ